MSPLATAIVALSAGVVAAVAAAYLNGYAERRRTHLEGRVAARLIRQDLQLIEKAVTRSKNSPLAPVFPQMNAWTEHRAALAAVMGQMDWHRVSQVFSAVALSDEIRREGTSYSHGDAMREAPEVTSVMHAWLLLSSYDVRWHPVLGPLLRLRKRIGSKLGRDDDDELD